MRITKEMFQRARKEHPEWFRVMNLPRGPIEVCLASTEELKKMAPTQKPKEPPMTFGL